jgi:hypothetical protein
VNPGGVFIIVFHQFRRPGFVLEDVGIDFAAGFEMAHQLIGFIVLIIIEKGGTQLGHVRGMHRKSPDVDVVRFVTPGTTSTPRADSFREDGFLKEHAIFSIFPGISLTIACQKHLPDESGLTKWLPGSTSKE